MAFHDGMVTQRTKLCVRKRLRHAKDVSVEGFPGSHVRWNGQPRLKPPFTKAALPLNVCIDVDEDQTTENGKEKVLGERSLS